MTEYYPTAYMYHILTHGKRGKLRAELLNGSFLSLKRIIKDGGRSGEMKTDCGSSLRTPVLVFFLENSWGGGRGDRLLDLIRLFIP